MPKKKELNASQKLAAASEGKLTDKQKAVSILKSKGGLAGGQAGRRVNLAQGKGGCINEAGVKALAEVFDQDAKGTLTGGDQLVQKILSSSANEAAEKAPEPAEPKAAASKTE